MRTKVKSHLRKTKRTRVRVRGHTRNYRSVPRLYREPIRPEELSEKELERYKEIMFPKRKPEIRRGLEIPTERQKLTGEQEAIMDQYQTALWAKDEELIKILKPQVEKIRAERSFGSSPKFITVEKKGKIIKTKQPREVLRLAKQLERQLKPYSIKVILAGSIRRKKPAKDIDIVLIPKKNKKDDIKRFMRKKGTIKAEGPKQIFANIKGVQADIFFSDKDSFGAQLLTRTGSAGHNIGLRQIAQQKKMLLNQYGLFKNNKKIAGKTEQEIYKKLGRPRFKLPEERG